MESSAASSALAERVAAEKAVAPAAKVVEPTPPPSSEPPAMPSDCTDGCADAPAPFSMGPREPPKTRLQQFIQQRLRVWQPILTIKWVVSIYIAAGFVFLLLGIALVQVSVRVVPLIYDYTDTVKDIGGIGSFDLQVSEDMQPPVWVYYQLEGFYQNHRQHLKSRDDDQLKLSGDWYAADTVPEMSCETTGPCCGDWFKAPDGRVNYPCGLVANRLFNDSFVLLQKARDSTDFQLLNVDSSAATIARATDAKGKQRFQNLDPEAKSANGQMWQDTLNMWILRNFPPEICEQIDFSNGYDPIHVRTRNSSEAEVPDCSNYMSTPSCQFERPCDSGYRRVKVKDWGLESGHFLVWMRPAHVSNFWKLWGRIDQKLNKGSTLRVYFENNFPVKGYAGRKGFAISTSTPLGGRNDFLGIGFIVVGSFCVAFGIVFIAVQRWSPRSLGDVRLLSETFKQQH